MNWSRERIEELEAVVAAKQAEIDGLMKERADLLFKLRLANEEIVNVHSEKQGWKDALRVRMTMDEQQYLDLFGAFMRAARTGNLDAAAAAVERMAR